MYVVLRVDRYRDISVFSVFVISEVIWGVNMKISIVNFSIKILRSIIFLIRNFVQTMKLTGFQPVSLSARYVVVPCDASLISDIALLSTVLPYSGSINITRRILLHLAGKKLCFVLIDTETGKAVGYSLFYFNKKDVFEKTIHEGYVGILPDCQGNGVGTAFRKVILQYFSKCKNLYGTSSRVSFSNGASLYSNLKNGYEIKERYFDRFMNEERAYMVCNLSLYRNEEMSDYR